MNRRMWTWFVVVGCQGGGDSTDTSGSTPTPDSTDWPHANRDLAGTRAALDAEICSDNVAQLAVKWVSITPGGAAITTNPIVTGDRVTYHTLNSDLVVLDLETGATVVEVPSGAPSLGPTGVAVDGDRMFAALDPWSFSALDHTSGSVSWTVDLRTHPTEGIDVQPIVAGGRVYVATVPSSPDGSHVPGAVGRLIALEADTGEVAWAFDTVDDPVALWGHPDVNSGGGASFPPSFDPDLGRLYWGVGNPGPFPGTVDWPNGSSRPGPNLYTNSLVALDTQTGALVWFDQITPHDLFDFDFHLSPVRVDVEIDGTVHPVVIGAGKEGLVVAWNADTGARLWETSVGDHENDDVAEIPDGAGLSVLPGLLGGAATPMAFAEGTVFVPVANLATTFTPSAATPPTPVEIEFGLGEIGAIDAATGRRIWTNHLLSPVLGGATVSCDLVFTATFDGLVYAYERHTGEEVWRWQAPGGIHGWFAVSGDTVLVPVGVSIGGSIPALVALSLD